MNNDYNEQNVQADEVCFSLDAWDFACEVLPNEWADYAQFDMETGI